jgi:4-amino-4-deoxy-L-arabinose transferase-like glycosyltransferase
MDTALAAPDRTGRTVAIAIAALVVVRMLVVIASPLELGPDESQYWRWGETLDWGYYSKPPLIAWVIGATTSVIGDAAWSVRIASPLAHGLAAWCLFLLGRGMFDARAGIWAAATYLLMPGVFLASTLMSTDTVLLPAWSAALLALWRLRESPTLLGGFLFGAAVGLGMMAKYAALYLLAGAALAALFDPPTRRALLSMSGLAALAGFALVIAPNVIWNAQNDFATVSHTTDNARWEEAGVSPEHFPEFLLDQMAVFGPVAFLVLVTGGAFLVRRSGDAGRSSAETWLLCFILPPLVIIAFQAVVSRAHANWAATAYPAASVLVASFLARPRWSTAVRANAWINGAFGTLFSVLVVAPSLGDRVGATGAFTRVRGWEATAQDLGAAARANNASVLMFDEREVWHGIDFAARDAPHSHAEEAGAMQPGEDIRVLVASLKPDFRPRIRADFQSIEPVGEIVTPLGPGRERRLKLYLASGYKPLPRTPDYEAAYAGKRED